MNRHTLDLLEFDKILGLVAGYAACSLGREAALRLEPLHDIGAIREQQALTTEMAEALAAGLVPPLGGIRDVRRNVRRAQVDATLAADELAEIAAVVRAVGDVASFLQRVNTQFPRLGALGSTVGEFSGLANAIASCLDERGKLLDTASRKLSNLRHELSQVEERIQETLRRLLRSSEVRRILRYPNFTMVGHHYVLPIAKEHRGEIQGSVHRTSASNETVFVEPQAVAEQSAQLSFLRAKEAKEIRRILRWLSAQVGHDADALIGTLETLADLAQIHARGRYSLEFQLSAPEMNNEAMLALRAARHPLLEHLFRAEAEQLSIAASGDDLVPAEAHNRREVVPIDVHLGFHSKILVITGPNTGGKTAALKTVGLLTLMAQSGLHVPAMPGSQLPVCDEVLADIGDEQSLEQSLSTFSSHVRRVSEILAVATTRSLVLMDEMGAGTDPAEGAALGRAILDELDSLGCLAMVTTHIGDLKTYAFHNPHVENAAVEFDHESLRPLFRLRIGDIGQSNALLIARRLRLSDRVIDRAAGYLRDKRGDSSPDWEIVSKLRREAEEARQAALDARAEAEQTRAALQQRLAELQHRSDDEQSLIEARARLQPGDRVVVPKFGYDRPGRIVKLDTRKQLAVVAIGQMKWDVLISELIPQTPGIPPAATGSRPTPPKPAGRLEDFPDETREVP